MTHCGLIRIISATGEAVEAFSSDEYFEAAHTVIVDALLGTGLKRRVSGHFAEAVAWINQQSAPVFALDVPSGLDADTGQARGCAVKATHTLTYIGIKQGLLTGQARNYVGDLHFDDLQVDEAVYSGSSGKTVAGE